MKRFGIFSVMLGVATLAMCIFANQTVYAFDSGSTGADGAFAPTSSTSLQIPESGVFNFTTVNIASGVTVTFKKNSGNTPVTILASGDVTIAGTINLNGANAGSGSLITPGKGGPGGADGGIGAYANSCGGNALGSGGGKAAKQVGTLSNGAGGGGGGFGAIGTTAYPSSSTYSTGGVGGSTYGNVNLLPMVGGSGGGGACGDINNVGGAGGGGGGGIAIASSGTINVTGTITANGGNGAGFGGGGAGGGGGGSGGAIKLMANIINGEGSITANAGNGGSSTNFSGGNGGAGRIRIEANTLQRHSNTSPNASFYDSPLYVFPAVVPTLKITRIGGVDVSASPTGSYGTPDILLPTNAANPVEVVVSATNIPVGTIVTINCVPDIGNSTTATATLSGVDASSSGTTQISIAGSRANVLSATATYIFQLASNQNPIYIGQEKVVGMKLATVMGGRSSVTYITESGKEVLAQM